MPCGCSSSFASIGGARSTAQTENRFLSVPCPLPSAFVLAGAKLLSTTIFDNKKTSACALHRFSSLRLQPHHFKIWRIDERFVDLEQEILFVDNILF